MSWYLCPPIMFPIGRPDVWKDKWEKCGGIESGNLSSALVFSCCVITVYICVDTLIYWLLYPDLTKPIITGGLVKFLQIVEGENMKQKCNPRKCQENRGVSTFKLRMSFLSSILKIKDKNDLIMSAAFHQIFASLKSHQ